VPGCRRDSGRYSFLARKSRNRQLTPPGHNLRGGSGGASKGRLGARVVFRREWREFPQDLESPGQNRNRSIVRKREGLFSVEGGGTIS